MAKRKLTARQRKAHKRASYIRREFNKTFNAIDYMSDFTQKLAIERKTKPTMRDLKRIRNIYNIMRKSIKKQDGYYLNLTTGEVLERLPTKEEMSQAVKSEPTQAYRESLESMEETPSDFNPDIQYLNSIIERIQNLTPLRDSNKTEHNFQKNVLPKFTEAQNRLLAQIQTAINKLGEAEAASIIASDSFMMRIENLEEKYSHEIIESIDDDLNPFIQSSIAYALDNI